MGLVKNLVSRFMRQAEEVLKRLIGSWSLVRWEERGSDGSVHYPLGEDAIGQLMYDHEGRMSARRMRLTTSEADPKYPNSVGADQQRCYRFERDTL
jgi:hypothetical protein